MNIISLTAPKSGSHLIGYALGLGTTPVWHSSSSGKPREFRTQKEMENLLDLWPRCQGIWTHIPHTTEMAIYLKGRFERIIFTRRDPRDIVVSLGHYMDKFPNSSLNWSYNGTLLSQMDWHKRMFYVIEEYGKQLLMFSPWIHEHGVWQLKYEDCIDDRERVLDVLRANLIADGLNPPTLAEMVESSLKKHQLSFRRGKYGDWKMELNNKHIEHAKIHLADAMEAYGYAW